MAEQEVAPFVLGQAVEVEDGALEVSWMLTQAMASRYKLVRVDIDEPTQSFVMRFEPVSRE